MTFRAGTVAFLPSTSTRRRSMASVTSPKWPSGSGTTANPTSRRGHRRGDVRDGIAGVDHERVGLDRARRPGCRTQRDPAAGPPRPARRGSGPRAGTRRRVRPPPPGSPPPSSARRPPPAGRSTAPTSMAENPNTPPWPRCSSAASPMRSASCHRSTRPSMTTNTSTPTWMKASRISSPGPNRSMRGRPDHVVARPTRRPRRTAGVRQHPAEGGGLGGVLGGVVRGGPDIVARQAAAAWADRDRVAGRAHGGVERLRHEPSSMYCFSAALTFVDHRAVALLDPDAVELVGEALADHLELAPGTAAPPRSPPGSRRRW